MFLQVSVILFTGGAWSWGVLGLGGICSRGVPGPGGSVCSRGGLPGPGGCLLWGEGCLVETPPDGLLLQAVRILLECILVLVEFRYT